MYDLAVVGAGPSGSAAARRAAQLGLDVVVLEKAEFPRDKPCGGALSEQAMSYLDFEVPPSLQEKDVYGARVVFDGVVLERTKDYRISTLVTRRDFDNLCFTKARDAGCVAHMRTRVTACEQAEDGVTLRTTEGDFDARYVILGEGAHGTLKHDVRTRDTRQQYGVCVVAEIPATEAEIDARVHRTIEIHFGVAHRGYGWVFPHRGYFSVGIGGLACDLPHPMEVMSRFVQQAGFSGEHPRIGHLIPAGGVKRKTHVHRCLLVGDAAGFVDSFYGEGLAYAIRSGQLAAEAVRAALGSGDHRLAFREYDSRCHLEFGANLRWSLLLASLMHRFPRPLFNIFCSHTEVLDRFLDVPAVRTTYSEYMRWLVPRIPALMLTSRRPR